MCFGAKCGAGGARGPEWPLAGGQTGIRAATRARRARPVTFDKMAKTPAVGKKAAKTPKKAGKSTKRSKRVESYRYAFF